MGIWGWREANSDIEDGFYQLNATSNIGGLMLENMGLRNSFMHYEIERHARNEYSAQAGPGFDGIHDLIYGIEMLIGPSFAPAD